VKLEEPRGLGRRGLANVAGLASWLHLDGRSGIASTGLVYIPNSHAPSISKRLAKCHPKAAIAVNPTGGGLLLDRVSV